MNYLYEGRPKVSVCVVTYNQESSIGKCLQSLLDQSVNFNIEIVVGDDCSTDGTRAVIQSFARNNPDVVKPRFQEVNQGPTRNYFAVHAAARGEYVAHIDGDDYALPGKLLQQATFLDTHPDCIAVVHRLSLVNIENKNLRKSWPTRFLLDKIDLIGLVRNHPLFGHSSLMYRRGAYASLIEDPDLSEIVDLYLYIHLVSQGKIGVIDAELGEYTIGVGISTKKNLYELVQQALNYANRLGLTIDDFKFASARQYLIFAEKAFVEGDFVLFECLIKQSLQAKKVSIRQQLLFFLVGKKWVQKFVRTCYKKFKSIYHYCFNN